MKSGKTTCSTCGMVWADGEEYQADHEKCGGEHCPLITGYDRKARLETIKKAALRVMGQQPAVVVDVWQPSEIIDHHGHEPKDTLYVLDVPKVLTMNVSKPAK